MTGRSLVLVVGLHGLFGAAVGKVISRLVADAARAAVVSVSLSAALLMLLLMLRAYSNGDPVLLGFIGCALLAGVCFEGFQGRAKRHRWLRHPDLWWLPIGLVLILALVASAIESDLFGTWIAVTTSSLCAALLVAHLMAQRRSRQPGLWHVPIISIFALASLGLLGVRVPLVEPRDSSADGHPSVLLITIDTLRADRLGVYGYSPARTAELDDLASRGAIFRQAVSHAIRTGPSHASILTGLLPDNHGVLINGMRLPMSVATIADVLHDEGYVTASFVSAYTTSEVATGLPSRFQASDDEVLGYTWLPKPTYHMSLVSALRKSLELLGFEFYWPYRDAAATTEIAIAWLERNGDRPFFVWVHYFDPHLPYRPPAAYLGDDDRQYQGPVSGDWYVLDAAQQSRIVTSPEAVERMLALYDAEIAFVDHQVGRLVRAAEEASTSDGLVIVATSDHGESMGEHNLFWRRDLYDPSLLVPLVIVPATDGHQGRRDVLEQVRLIDIAPTILDLVDVQPLDEMDGQSLVDLIYDEGSPAPGPAQSGSYRPASEFSRSALSVRDGEWKLIERSAGWTNDQRWSDRTRELYHLSRDPEERYDVIDERPPVLSSLRAEAEARWSRSRSVEVDLSPEAEERLRALGYVP